MFSMKFDARVILSGGKIVARPKRRVRPLKYHFLVGSARSPRPGPSDAGRNAAVGRSRLFMPDKPQRECGVFGVYGHPDAALLTYYGLFALQRIEARRARGSYPPQVRMKL